MKKSGLVLTISGDTVDEIKEKLVVLAKQFGATTGENAAPPAAPKRGPKKKDEDDAPTTALSNGHGGNGVHANGAAAVAAPSAADDMFADAPAAKKAGPTREEVQRAIVEVQTKKGLPSAREVISKFGAKRFAELQEKDFAGVIDACRQALV